MKYEIEEANNYLAQHWHDKLIVNGVNVVDALEYETLRILGAIWKGWLDAQRVDQPHD